MTNLETRTFRALQGCQVEGKIYRAGETVVMRIDPATYRPNENLQEMSKSIPGGASAAAPEPTSPEPTPKAPIVPGPTFEDLQAVDHFARGVLDVTRQLCASLIGRGIVDAQDLQEHMNSVDKFWSENGFSQRGEPAKTLAAALGGMAAIKRETDAQIFKGPPGVN
jgi:hypothetical protein